jgi:hypothetical protein
MQDDLDADYPELDIQILGVNEVGREADNDLIAKGRDIPWLQDVDDDHDGWSDVWTAWDVIYRDVVILDGENVKVGAFNLSTYNLQVPANYDALRQMLVEAASVPGDLDGDGDADVRDHTVFATCLNGPGVATPPSTCTQEQFNLCDLDTDSDVDLSDFRVLQAVLTSSP